MPDKYQVLIIQVNVNGVPQEITATVKAFCGEGDHVILGDVTITEPREMPDDHSWGTMGSKDTEELGS